MKGVVVLLLGLVFLAGCSQQLVCDTPYLLVGDSCCLDKDGDRICDAHQDKSESAQAPECPACELDCTTCPPRLVQREEIVLQYVCEDGRVVNESVLCEIASDIDYVPITTNQEGTQIELTSARPACQASFPGGELYYEVNTVPEKVSVEVRPVGLEDEWEELLYVNGYYERYIYFTICEDSFCPFSRAEFTLEPGKVYVMRMKFEQPVWNTVEYSNEFLIDARPTGEYMTKRC